MASATVRLKEGKSYSYSDGPNTIKFTTDRPTSVVGAELIEKLQAINCLSVEVHQDRPVTPISAKKAAKPVVVAPEPEPEEAEVQVEVESEEEPAAEAVEAEAESAPDPEPEPAKPAKKGFFGKSKKGS